MIFKKELIDFIDIFIIAKGNINKLNILQKEILRKIKPALKYEKYSKNFIQHKSNFSKFIEDDEERLLLIKIDKNSYEIFLKEFNKFLNKTVKKLI